MKIISYDGFTFADQIGSWADIDMDTEYGWQINQTVVQRGGDLPLFGSGNLSPRTIDVTFTYQGSRTDYWQIFDELIGKLRPEDQSNKRKLTATRPDGTTVYRYARISVPSTAPEVNWVVVRFVSEDPRWYETTATTVTPWDSTWTHPAAIYPGVNTPAFAVPNTGTAAVHPTVTIKAGGYSAGTGGWLYRRKQTLTNNLSRTINNVVVMIDLGDTAALVSGGKALSSGNDFRVVGPDGLEVPRNLVNWNTALSWVYIYVASMEPGESQDFYLVYGNSAAGSPKTLVYPYVPAYRVDWRAGTSSSSVDASKLWINIGTGGTGVSFDGQWNDCALYFVNGANAGVGRRIVSSENGGANAGRVTVDSAFANALNTADDWVIISSRNPSGTAYWIYTDIRGATVDTSNSLGRWYLSSGTSQPDVVDYTVPGSWQPTLYKDGRDKKGQSRWYGPVASAYRASLDAERTWENGPTVTEEGAADGVMFSSPFPILDYDSTIIFTNSIGMAKVFIGARAAGGNDWRELYSNTTVTSGAYLTPNVSVPSGMLQIYHGLIPYEGEEIGQDWRRDSGSSTGVGSTTTLVDSKKSWKADQWIGGTLRMTGGRRSGQHYAITDNTGTVITIGTTLGNAVKVDQPYEVVNPQQLALLLDGGNPTTNKSDHLPTLALDVSGLAISALATEESCIDLSVRFWIGGGNQSSTVFSGHRRAYLDVGKNADYWLMVKNSTGDYVALDSAKRTATMYNAAGTVLDRFVDPRVRWRYYDTDGNQLASQNGMMVPPGVSTLVNPGAESNVSNWTKANSGTITSAITRDTTYYVKGVASFKLNVSASTGPAYTEMVADDRIPIQPGDLAQFAAYVLTESATIKPLLGIRFYTSGLATISTDLQGTSPTYTITRWYAEGHAAVAPATSAFWAPVVRANIASGSPTGAVFFDDVNVGAPVMFLQNDHNIGDVTVSFVEGYLA